MALYDICGYTSIYPASVEHLSGHRGRDREYLSWAEWKRDMKTGTKTRQGHRGAGQRYWGGGRCSRFLAFLVRKKWGWKRLEEGQ